MLTYGGDAQDVYNTPPCAHASRRHIHDAIPKREEELGIQRLREEISKVVGGRHEGDDELA